MERFVQAAERAELDDDEEDMSEGESLLLSWEFLLWASYLQGTTAATYIAMPSTLMPLDALIGLCTAQSEVCFLSHSIATQMRRVTRDGGPRPRGPGDSNRT